MYSKAPPSTMKRPREDNNIEAPRKCLFKGVKTEDNTLGEGQIFKFRILLPNGTTLELKLSEQRSEISIEEFLVVVEKEHRLFLKQRKSLQPKRRINWAYQDLHFTDSRSRKLRTKVNFRDYRPDKWHFLWLHDGSAEPESYEDMWDLTPDTDLLKELPDDYTFETALADLIDNSLQALWSNEARDERLISLELHPNRITIFDSGQGMDGTDGNLVKWGKMGASIHRSMRGKAVGGKPPYLVPFFGMFGYGGSVAAMCLGRRAVVSSKTKNHDKVFTLHLEKEALMSASSSENTWRTKGGMRDPLEDEKENSRHGSFMKVEIFEPKMKMLDVKNFRCKLKDIYFPYIQCDEMSGKTSRPIEFKVNGEDLAGIEGGEVATTNLHSCNGPNFSVQLHFSIFQEHSSTQNQKVLLEANARLKCVYFPIVEGHESIQRIIDKLNADGCGIRESYNSFSRVSVRRLGRLLPDTRWALLPFMESKKQKGEKAQTMKRCCSRVKCFIDTDSGFNPTPHKTDLAQHHPYTKALKNFGNRTPENEKEVQVEIERDGKKITLTQLEKQYYDWISEMHDRYDEEIDGGLDPPTIVVVTSKIKKLDITSDVLRVHKKIKRRGKCWAAGQNIKVLKGACAGCHKQDIYATLEYIILEGLPGDACGDARLICRTLGTPENKGCHLLGEDENKTIDIRDSLVLPIRIIDSEKCAHIDNIKWKKQLETHNQKLPSSIDLLKRIDCQELEIDGELSTELKAGDTPPANIVAVVRPKAFNSKNNSKSLDQKFIVKDNLEMTLEVKSGAGVEQNHIYAMRVSPASRKGINGLYLFPVRSKIPQLFQKAGFYTFSLSLKERKDLRIEQVVQVKASAEDGSWKLVNQDKPYTIRVGSRFKTLSIKCCDTYNNHILFRRIPKLTVKLCSNNKILAQVHNMKVNLTTDKSIMQVKDIVVRSGELDDIRPNYEATLTISALDEAFSVVFPCQVIPGTPQRITIQSTPRKQLIPGHVIEELVLEVFDEYGNHSKEEEIISLRADGFTFQDGSGIARDASINCTKKVDANGFVDLSNILKVSRGYGKDVSLSVISKEDVIFKLDFQTVTRELRAIQKVYNNCQAGSQLENIVFEIVNSEGKVDETIHDEDKHGQSHTLTIKSNSFDIDDSVRYSFRHGRCAIRFIPLPYTEGIFSFSASHTRYPELRSDIEVHIEKARPENRDNIWSHEDVGNPNMNRDNISNHEDVQNPNMNRNSIWNHVRNPNMSPRNQCESLEILPQTPSLKVSPLVNISVSPQSSNRYVLPSYSPSLRTPKLDHENKNPDILPVQLSASQDIGNFVDSAPISEKEIVDDFATCGMTMMEQQRKLEMLTSCQSHIRQKVSDLQASIDRELGHGSSICTKELILKQIQSKSQSAASIFCKQPENVSCDTMPGDILGVVAVLASVGSVELSRMFAQYLGEDQMLAIVCENYATAYYLETSTLPEIATKGQTIRGGYLALCLEDIRPAIISEPSSDPQEPLPLKMPVLQNGNKPDGFLGYAVNMISIEASHQHWKTKSGFGLRETLFYRLFGDLQVYRDRESMMMAETCIEHGALSLDGYIMRGNGLVSLGHWEPDILFPVKLKPATPRSIKVLQLLEVKKLELMRMSQRVDEARESFNIENEKYLRSRDRYMSCVSQKEPPSTARSSQRTA